MLGSSFWSVVDDLWVSARTFSLTRLKERGEGVVYTTRRWAPRLRLRWMRKPRKSKPSSRWTILVLVSERWRPMGSSAAWTLARSASACSRVPETHDHEVVRVADES